jgi:hypothetical protein
MFLYFTGSTTTEIYTLALGIGANTAIFSVVDAVVLRPLPYPNSDQIVFITDNPPRDTIAGRNSFLPLIDDQRQYSEIFSHVASVGPGESTITGVSQPEPLSSVMVSPDYFSILGVQPVLGRDFLSGEAKHGASPVVLLRDALCRRDFNAEAENQRDPYGEDAARIQHARGEQLQATQNNEARRINQDCAHRGAWHGCDQHGKAGESSGARSCSITSLTLSSA